MKTANDLRSALRLPHILNVHDTGGNKPVVVLLHGLATSSRNWNSLVELLEPDFRCITIDLLGFGDSPKPQGGRYTIEEHVRSIRHTIQTLKLEEDFTLIGHSLGALLACRLASRHPTHIRNVLLLSPPIYLHPSQISHVPSSNATTAYLKMYDFLKTHKEFTISNLNRLAKLSPSNAMFEITEETWNACVRTLENCIEKQTILTDIVEIDSPIDVFYGTLDQFIVRKNLDVLAKMRHVRLHELNNVDHMVRERYAQAIQKHIKASK